MSFKLPMAGYCSCNCLNSKAVCVIIGLYGSCCLIIVCFILQTTGFPAPFQLCSKDKTDLQLTRCCS